MTDSFKYRFLFYIDDKNKLILQKFFRKYDKKNTFILANVCPKISRRGRKELPIERV